MRRRVIRSRWGDLELLVNLEREPYRVSEELILGGEGFHARAPGLVPWERLAERYEQMLLRRPREGTALRNLYRHHIESMTVEAWLAGVGRQ